MMNEQGGELKALCRRCGHETNHDVLFTKSINDSEEDIFWGTDYQTVRCRGCEDISFRTSSWSSEDYEPDGSPAFTTHLYPQRTEGVSLLGSDALQWLPYNVWRAYDEATKAFQAGASVLATIGLRSLIEAVCKEKGATGRDLVKKIDALVEMGELPAERAELLHLLREFGNRAAHMVQPLPQEDLIVLLEVVQQLLRTTYQLPHVARAVKRRDGARKRLPKIDF